MATAPGKMRRMAGYKCDADFVAEEVDAPEVPPGGFLIKVACAGVCHSDLYLKSAIDTLFKDFTPVVFGHEVSGYVHKISDTITACDLSVGDRVVLYSWGGCLQCTVCDTDICPKHFSPVANELGMFKPGGYQEYLPVLDRRLIFKLPASIPMDYGCLLACSGLTTYNAMSTLAPAVKNTVRLNGRASVLIVGAGGLGLWAVHWSKVLLPTASVKVVVADVDKNKLEQAKREGADDVVHWDREAPEDEVIAATRSVCEGGIDGCIDLVNIPATVRKLVAATNFGATSIQVGLMGGDCPAFPLETFILKCLTLRGIYVGTLAQQNDVLTLVEKHKISPPPITHYQQSELNEVLDKLSKGQITGRAVIKYDCSEYE